MSEPTIRLKIVLAYQGAGFAGWQYQPEALGRSVQACLEAALTTLAGRPVRVLGASRTDAGVHALHQVAHADVPAGRAGLPWVKALNALVPRDMAVLSVETVSHEFHARRDAGVKTYVYTLWHHPHFVLPQRRPFVWPVGPVDFAAMQQGAAHLVGCHDFAAFRNLGTVVKSTVRTVLSISLRPVPSKCESAWEVRGVGFLKQMVRNIMGALVFVGRGKANPDFVRSVLLTKDRSLAPATAPARGLCLEHMEFADCERHPGQIGSDRPSLDCGPGEAGLCGPGGAEPKS